MDNNTITEKRNKKSLKVVIVGVGSGGTLAVENLMNSNIADKITFVAVDGDKQALKSSKVPHTFQLPESYVFEEITIEESEKREMIIDERLDNIPTPFGFINHQWEELKAKIKEGDKLYYFRSGKNSWNNLCGREGYALYRDDEEIDSIVIKMN
jgi:hypothetical protein